ncbi:MAG: aldo/keto reductase [Actinobacteria bacterium]|nr:aldo/keto reductase [Actinomycetota bacterium]
MEQRQLGESAVGVVGLGCNNFGRRLDAERTAAVVDAALDAGVTLFDTADVYGDGLSEEYLGRALRGRRDTAVIATKVGHPMGDDPRRAGASARWIREAAADSLRRLQTDHIDLYQLHVPDDTVPIEETLGAFDELVQRGDVLAIGASNFSPTQIDEAADVARARAFPPFVGVQNRYSVLTRDPEWGGVLDACARNGCAFLPYFPLESGVLTGKYTAATPPRPGSRLSGDSRAERFLNDRYVDLARQLEAYAQERGRSLLELAISWLVAQPLVASVIAGATTPDQVRANVAASAWTLTRAELDEIDAIVGASAPR